MHFVYAELMFLRLQLNEINVRWYGAGRKWNLPRQGNLFSAAEAACVGSGRSVGYGWGSVPCAPSRALSWGTNQMSWFFWSQWRMARSMPMS